MPNAKVLSEKQAIVEALAERIKSAGAGILVDYRGITVLEDTALRAEMRKEGIDYTVVKNTLTRKALDKLGMSGLDDVLNGTTSLATTAGDPIAPFRIVSDYSEKLKERFNIKAAFMDGQILSESVRDRGDRAASFQGRSVREGPGHHDRTHHRPGRLSRPDPGAEGRLSRVRRSRSRCGMIAAKKNNLEEN